MAIEILFVLDQWLGLWKDPFASGLTFYRESFSPVNSPGLASSRNAQLTMDLSAPMRPPGRGPTTPWPAVHVARCPSSLLGERKTSAQSAPAEGKRTSPRSSCARWARVQRRCETDAIVF